MFILETLKSKNKLSNVEIIIAHYLLNNKNKISKMTLSDIANEAQVSVPSFIVFYRKLGFNKFQDFKVEFQKEIVKEEKTKIIDSNIPFFENDNELVIAQNISNLTKQTIDSCVSLLDQNLLHKAIEYLHLAKRIFIFGLGDCFIEAQSLISKLTKLKKYAIMLNANSYPYVNIYNLNDDDVVLIITSTGKTMKLEKESLSLITKSKAKTILITADDSLNLSFNYNIILKIYHYEHDTVKLGNFASQISIVYTLNVIFACLFAKEYKNNLKIIQEYYDFLLNIKCLN